MSGSAYAFAHEYAYRCEGERMVLRRGDAPLSLSLSLSCAAAAGSGGGSCCGVRVKGWSLCSASFTAALGRACTAVASPSPLSPSPPVAVAVAVAAVAVTVTGMSRHHCFSAPTADSRTCGFGWDPRSTCVCVCVRVCVCVCARACARITTSVH